MEVLKTWPNSKTSWHWRGITQQFVLLWLTISMSCGLASGYKPIILIHGVNADGDSLDDLKQHILAASPGTNVTALDIYDNLLSFLPLYHQLPGFIKLVRPIMQAAPNGVHLICHSQGGLVCRGIVEMMPDHNVDTFITLSSPLFGQFGIPPSWSKFLPMLKNKTRDEVSKLVYTTLFQDLISVANYWRDPRPEYFKKYEEYCRYLPVLDNNPKAANYRKDGQTLCCVVTVVHNTIFGLTETPVNLHVTKNRISFAGSQTLLALGNEFNSTGNLYSAETAGDALAMAQKKNFLRINRMVSLGGPDDGVINPWQSSVFGFLSPDVKTVVPMKGQKAYTEDWFGLRTLDEKGGIVHYEVPHINHHGWHRNKTIFDTLIRKWLR